MRMRTINTALMAVFAVVSVTLHAADYVWIGGESGAWNVRTNWDPMPTSAAPGNYNNLVFTNAVTFSDEDLGNQYMYVYVTNLTAELHLYAGGLHRARHMFISGGGALHLWETGCLDLLRSDAEIKGQGGGSIFCHGTDVFPPQFYKMTFPQLLDLGGFNQTITNISQCSQGLAQHVITSETPALLTFSGSIGNDCQTYGYIKGQAGICWNPDNSARKLTLYHYASDTKGELIVSNGVVEIYSDGAKFLNLSRTVIGSGGTLKCTGTATFKTAHLIMMNGAKLDFGTSGTPTTCELSRVTLVDENGVAADLPQGVYGATAGDGVIYCDRIVGIHRIGVTPTMTYWKSAQSGTWATADNWTQGVPSLSLCAGITEPGGDYTVTVDAPAVTTNLTIRNNGGGTAALNVASRLELTNGVWDVGSGGKITVSEYGELCYSGNASSKFNLFPGGRIEVCDYGVLRTVMTVEYYIWSQTGGSLDFSGHSTLDLGGMWDVCLGKGQTVFRDDAKMVGDGAIGNGTARLYFSAAAGAPTEVWFRDRAVYSSGSSGSRTELRPSGGGRIAMHFDSAATHSLGYLMMARSGQSGYTDLSVSNGILKVDSTGGLNQGGASVYCNANSFATGHVYQTGGAFVVNGESGSYNANFQYGFILGDGLTSTTVREPTVLGVYELSGGVVTNESIRSPFVLGIGRGRGEFIQTGGEFVSKATDARAPAIFGFSNGYGYYVLSNGTAKISSKIWVGGVDPATCSHAHASYVGTEAVGGITVAAADMSKPCRFEVSDTVVLGGLGEGTLDVGPGGTFAGTSLVLSNNTASALSFRVTDEGFGAVNLSGKLTVTDGASLVIDARGFTGQNFRRCRLMNFASKTGDFAPEKVTVLTDGTTPCYFRISETGLRFGRETGTIISVW